MGAARLVPLSSSVEDAAHTGVQKPQHDFLCQLNLCGGTRLLSQGADTHMSTSTRDTYMSRAQLLLSERSKGLANYNVYRLKKKRGKK